MTLIAASALQAPTLSGLTARGDTAGTGVYLQWVTPVNDILWATEIWYATTNNRGSASLYKTIVGNDTLFVGTPGTTYYFWVRSVSIYGKSNGAWYPTSSTAGVSSLVDLITYEDIEPNSLSLSYFHDAAFPVAGAGGGSYASVVSLSITNNVPAYQPVIYSFSCIQRYSGAAVTTKWLLQNSSTGGTIKDYGQFDDKTPIISLGSLIMLNPSSTETFTLYWWGANSTVTRSNLTVQVLGLRI